MVNGSIGENLDVGGVQHQTMLPPAGVGATEKAPHAHRGPRRQMIGDSGKGLAAGHDRNPAARLAGHPGFHLPGMMLQQKAADRDSGRRNAGFTGSRQLTGDHQAIIGERREQD